MQPTVKFSVRHGRGWGCEKGGGVVKSGRWQRSAFPVKADPMDQKIGPLWAGKPWITALGSTERQK